MDHSIREPGGHHLEYASHVLDAAEVAGYEPILATNARFPTCREGESRRTLRIFRSTCYDFMRIDARVHRATRLHAPPWWIDRMRLGMMKRSLSRAVSRLLDDLGVGGGDVVFFSTVTPVELLELAELSRTHPAFADARVHAMLHFPLHEGRCSPLEHRGDFARGFRALAASPRARIAIHATNAALAAQFRMLGCVECDELPWAVNPEIVRARDDVAAPRSAPLRIGFPGSTRDERGSGMIESLFRELRGDLLDGSCAQLLLQSPGVDSLPASMRAGASFHETVADAMESRAPVAVVRWPLSGAEYAALIRATDLGLLPYDPDRYYARASGVLVEMLGSGTPVVVLAGSWLGRQFRERAWEHADAVRRRLQESDVWSLPMFRLEPRQGPAEFRIDLSHAPEGSVALALTLRWSAPSDDEGVLRLTIESDEGRQGAAWRELLERRPPSSAGSQSEPQSLLIPLLWRRGVVRLRFEHAGCGEAIQVEDIGLRALSPGVETAGVEPGAPPISAVGLQAADPGMLAALIREAIHRYPAYRASAEKFAESFREAHLPSAVIRRLTSTATS